MRLLGIIISLCIGYFVMQHSGLQLFKGASVEVSADGFVAIDSGDKYFEYDIKDAIEYSGYRVLQFDKSNYSLRTFGIQYQLALLSEADYEEFEAIQADGACPASFLNEHAEMLLLVVPDSYSKDFRPSDIHAGDSVEVHGSELTFAYGEIKGHEVSQMSGTNQVAPFLIDAIKVL